MPRETERRVLALIGTILRARIVEQSAPPWLLRPGRVECRRRWRVVRRIYHELTGEVLQDEMPLRERRHVDGIIEVRNQLRIIEVDEDQHFNGYRAATLRVYPKSVPLAFDRGQWIEWSDGATHLRGGGFGKPRPPLFPGHGGRHRQRAFRDGLCDLLPPLYDYLPTLRIAEREVRDWIHMHSAKRRLSELLEVRGVL